MSDKKHKKALDKLSKVKARLVLDRPFFGVLICNLETIIDENIWPPTAQTNGKWIKYHPDFVEKCSFEELSFLVCHEILHVAFLHMARLGGRHPIKWNIAADFVINDLLTKEGVGNMPEGGLLDPELVEKGKGHAEGVYDLLPDNSQGGGRGNGQGQGQRQYGESDLFDVMQPLGSTPAEQAEAEGQIRVMVAQAAQAAKIQGKLSANMERFVGNALKPKVDWRTALRQFICAKAKVEPTFARPKRRFIDMDLYLPSLGGERMGAIAVFVDCSGSIHGKELDQFASEIRAIKEDVHPEMVHVIYFDDKVCHYDVFGQDDELVLRPHGGGGTAFEPCFDFVEKNALDIVCGVFLTDGYGSCNCPPPAYPVLWVTTGTDKFPFGQVIEMHP